MGGDNVQIYSHGFGKSGRTGRIIGHTQSYLVIRPHGRAGDCCRLVEISGDGRRRRTCDGGRRGERETGQDRVLWVTDPRSEAGGFQSGSGWMTRDGSGSGLIARVGVVIREASELDVNYTAEN
jgi:hypothetical protein